MTFTIRPLTHADLGIARRLARRLGVVAGSIRRDSLRAPAVTGWGSARRPRFSIPTCAAIIATQGCGTTASLAASRLRSIFNTPSARPRPVIPRQRALRDIEEAVAWYLGEDAASAALGFIDAVEQAFEHIGRNPAAGSPRYALELNLPGLRWWPLARATRWHC